MPPSRRPDPRDRELRVLRAVARDDIWLQGLGPLRIIAKWTSDGVSRTMNVRIRRARALLRWKRMGGKRGK